MGTNTEPTLSGRRYRSHPPEFKRQLVAASYLPGASVARVAQAHGINANQLFAWRKLLRDQALSTSTPSEMIFMPVSVRDPIADLSIAAGTTASTNAENGQPGRMELTVGKACLTIHGSPDTALLRIVLAELLR
jgi:transposase